MSKEVVFCEKCFVYVDDYIKHIKNITGLSENEIKKYFTIGYYTQYVSKTNNNCPCHTEQELQKSILTIEEYETLLPISSELSFIQAMEQLKQTDIIEFNLKISQFKSQLNQQESTKVDNRPKCPHCHSNNIKSISGLERAGSIAMWGLFSKKINKSFKCSHCGYTW